MAKIQYGALVTELKGKIGGTVFQSGRYGFQVRNKPTPIRTASRTQSAVRSTILTISKAWRDLTEPQRLAYDAIAPSWPAVDAFGNPMLLTGYNVFCKTNFWSWSLSGLINPTASLPAALWQPSTISLSVAAGAATFDLSFSPSPIDNSSGAVIYLSGQVSAGRSTPPSNMRAMEVYPVATVSPIDLSLLYAAKSGTFPTAGNRVFVGVQAVSTVNGTAGPIAYTSTIVLP
jgi:hypothetical protein